MDRGGSISRAFARIGASVEVGELKFPDAQEHGRALTVDVVATRRGERFLLLVNPRRQVNLAVLHVSRPDRHLVLLGRDDGPQGASPAAPVLSRFLCGHDERHWFAAVVPGRGVTTVAQAREALRPSLVRGSLLRHGVRVCDRDRRRNPGCIRQGEWFFVPSPDFNPPDAAVLQAEPLRRGFGKPHWAEELYRTGGTQVHVPERTLPPREWRGPDPNRGLTGPQWAQFRLRHPDLSNGRWRVMRRDPMAFARGRIVHPDHRTVILPCWHRVVPNTESRAWPAVASLAFLD